MPNIKEYIAISEIGLEEFNKTVNGYLNKGWKPIGGVSSAILTIHKPDGVYFQYEYSQAMILYDDVIRTN